jgi:hypothetical protein
MSNKDEKQKDVVCKKITRAGLKDTKASGRDLSRVWMKSSRVWMIRAEL